MIVLSKVPKFVKYEVDEEYFVRKDYDISEIDVTEFSEFIEDMSNF